MAAARARQQMVLPARRDRELMESGSGAGCVALVFIVGLLFESIGVATGWAYRYYHYSGELGPKFPGCWRMDTDRYGPEYGRPLQGERHH